MRVRNVDKEPDNTCSVGGLTNSYNCFQITTTGNDVNTLAFATEVFSSDASLTTNGTTSALTITVLS
jgi:hypothetical protein